MTNRRKPQPIVSNFDKFCSTFNVKPHERATLVWHLAAYRARRTVQALLPDVAAATKPPQS